MFSPSPLRFQHTTTSAAICRPIPAPYDADSPSQNDRLPRVIRATFTAYIRRIYVPTFRMVSGFEFHGPLAQMGPPLSAGCSSDRSFAYSFLQIPPRDGHPCCSARSSHHQGLLRDLHPKVSDMDTTDTPVALTRYAPCRGHHVEAGEILIPLSCTAGEIVDGVLAMEHGAGDSCETGLGDGATLQCASRHETAADIGKDNGVEDGRVGRIKRAVDEDRLGRVESEPASTEARTRGRFHRTRFVLPTVRDVSWSVCTALPISFNLFCRCRRLFAVILGAVSGWLDCSAATTR